MSNFQVDWGHSEDGYLHVEIPARGTVQIKNEGEGIVVDVFPLNDESEPVASTWAHDNDLIE